MVLQVLMVDDHPPIIEGYKAILSAAAVDYQLETVVAYTAQTAFEIITSSKSYFNVVFIDITLPPFLEGNIFTGEDLIPLVKKHHPQSKIIILTSHSESILLHRILKNHQPEGVFVKSDFQSKELMDGFDAIVNGKTHYSQTVLTLQKAWNENESIEFDTYNQQILVLLSQGVKTKSLPDLLHLSQSAIDKRKATIKVLLGISKGNDEDILKAARKQGLI